MGDDVKKLKDAQHIDFSESLKYKRFTQCDSVKQGTRVTEAFSVDVMLENQQNYRNKLTAVLGEKK